MKKMFSICLFMGVMGSFVSLPSYALSFNNILETAGDKEYVSPLKSGVDMIAGEGMADVISGAISPEIVIVGEKMGIPVKYYPQLQELYDGYKKEGEVSATDISSKEGLGSWLEKEPNLDAVSLATSLGGLFSK